MNTNIEKLFNDEIRSKKRTASGIYHRASRRGYIKGGVKTQSDFMTRKEKNKLNGKVKVYNMYDKYNVIENVPNISEIEKLPENEKINLYKFLKFTYKNKVLQEHWNISSGSLYNNIYKKYGLYSIKQRKIKKDSKDYVYKSINDVPSINEIMDMSKTKIIGILTTVKCEFTTIAICEHWNISKPKLYQMYKEYGITKSRSNKNIEQPVSKNSSVIEIENEDIKMDNDEKQFNIDQFIRDYQKSIELKENNISNEINNTIFSIKFNGEYSKDSIENKLLSISKILEENKNYKINFLLQEI